MRNRARSWSCLLRPIRRSCIIFHDLRRQSFRIMISLLCSLESHEFVGSVESWPLISKLYPARDFSSSCRKELRISVTYSEVLYGHRENRVAVHPRSGDCLKLSPFLLRGVTGSLLQYWGHRLSRIDIAASVIYVSGR
jgi:hypothetical protein